MKPVTPNYRKISWPESVGGAYECFAARPRHFSAILEDPSGKGMAWLTSRQGMRLSFAANATGPGDIFAAWSRILPPITANSEIVGIRCLLYAAYEAGGLIEQLPEPKTWPGPLLYLLLPDWSVGFDRRQRCIHLCSTKGEQILDMLEAMLARPRRRIETPGGGMKNVRGGDAGAYIASVRRVKKYIRAGDVFQANIARFWRADFPDEQGPALFGRLRQVNPAPFSAWMYIESRQGPMQIISASPERLFRLGRDGWLETRPIAGTRRRGTGEGDIALRKEMLLSEKERAEHIMLVDLERNDLGRVCRPGTVGVNERMTVESYATVQHIVSNIRGKLIAGEDVAGVFRAMFPGGTITGCPKVRCMEIIHELEGRARGPYTGGIAYIAWDGSADMNILIRTFWLHQGVLNWAAGAGIVADSDPAFELAETDHKATGLIRALT